MRQLKREIWPYKITIDRPDDINEIEFWLGNTLGIFRRRWNAVYGFRYTDYYFKNERDLILFTLKWF